MTKIDFAPIFERAHAAGMAAGTGTTPVPMTVQQHAGGPAIVSLGVNGSGGVGPVLKEWFVPEGLCGFAWVTIFPGTSAAARFAKKHWQASAAYGGGTQIWVHQFNQSIARKEAYAHAFAQVLQDAGIKAYSGSRLD